jgi:tetraacyldisaccharide 4'-kinase
LSWIYGAWMRRRNTRFDRPGASERVSVPVISVGNLSAGGTGKTPMVGWLATNLLQHGARPAIVSRGYGGGAGKGPVVVSTGEGPLVDASISGDEPWMLADSIPGVIVVVGSNRRAGARRAIELGADSILLDDGFQHRALARDVDIVLLDRTRPFYRDALLPVGLLREPPASLARADWIVITRGESAEGAERLLAAIRAANPEARVAHSDHRIGGFVNHRREPKAAPRRAVAFCGIGHPERFRADLEAQGVEIAAFRPFRDHQPLGRRRLRRLQQLATEHEAVLVTTVKDLARIGPAVSATYDLTALHIETHVIDGEPLIDAILKLVNRTPR